MANDNLKLVSAFFFSFLVSLFMFFIFNEPNKVKENSNLSEHFFVTGFIL